MESKAEQFNRIAMMADNANCGTWDLSDNDERALASASEVVSIANELIEFVAARYGVISIDGFTCDIHRRLARALGKF